MLFAVLPLTVTYFRRASTTQSLHRGCDTLDIKYGSSYVTSLLIRALDLMQIIA